MNRFKISSIVSALHCFLAAILFCSGGMAAEPQDATVMCPTCSQAMPAKLHFCGNCGTNLEGVGRPEPSSAPTETKKPSFLGLFGKPAPVKAPAGDHDSAFSDVPVPLKTIAGRPKPLLEVGQNPFLAEGTIYPGFTLPTGAVWQPAFILYGTGRSAFQVFDDGKRQVSEWANRIDLFGNLYVTPTERLLIGIRPLDRRGKSTGYRFFPNPDKEDQINGNLQTLFFEGDFGELFPKLDPNDRRSLDYGFAVGRQPLSIQDGIMINDDAIDAVSITRSSLFLFGSSAMRATILFAWNGLNRNDNSILDNSSAKLIGLFTSSDYSKGTADFDLAYVNDANADGLYLGLGITRRVFGLMNLTFRINTSFALDQESAAVSNGTLLFSQLSTVLPHGKDVLYFNSFWAIDNYSSADRGRDAGGPLGQTGILFAAQGLGNYGAPLGNRANSAVGFGLGYQKYLGGGTDQQVVLEVGGRTPTRTPRFFAATQPAAFAAAARYQKKLNQHSVLIFDTFVGFPERRDTSYGFRAELLFKF